MGVMRDCHLLCALKRSVFQCPADSRDEDLHVRDNRAAWRVPTSFCDRKHPREFVLYEQSRDGGAGSPGPLHAIRVMGERRTRRALAGDEQEWCVPVCHLFNDLGAVVAMRCPRAFGIAIEPGTNTEARVIVSGRGA